MITKADLIKYDRSQMCNIYNQWPKIAKNAYNLKIEQIDFKNINHLVFAGMGGSGTIGDMFASILSKTNIQVSVVKGFHLPSTINNKSLVRKIKIKSFIFQNHPLQEAQIEESIQYLAHL